jgi:phage/plasmid-like protein (TIGR03299 family)
MPAEVESMFYYGQRPWHGLGTEVDHALTANEALIAAGLNWEVELVPVYFRRDDAYNPIMDKRGIMRKDNKELLGVVGNRYTPLQNIEAFNFFDEVVGNKQGKYVTAGSLKGGRRIWILAKVGETFHIADSKDEIDRYALLFNSHDGTSQVKMMITPIRVVCNNTLSAALNMAERNKEMVKLRHTSGIINAAKDVKDVLNIVNDYYEIFSDNANILAKTFLTVDGFQNYLDNLGFVVVEEKTEDDERYNRRIIRVRETIERLFDEGLGMDMNRHSVWNAYNAVVEYVDHNRASRKTAGYSSAQEARLDSLWFGEGARIKRQAWDVAMQLV